MLHQQRTPLLRNSSRRIPVILTLLLIVALLSHIALALEPQLAGLIAAPRDDVHETLRGWFAMLAVLMGVLVMVQHLSLAAFGLQVAAVGVAREKQGRTWESLLLTGVDARRIVVGKWFATVQVILSDYRSLLVLRFLVVLWIWLASGFIAVYPWYEPPPITAVIVYAALIAIFPPVYAAFSAALGVLAGLITSSQTAAVRVGGLLHLGTIMLSFAVMFILLIGRTSNLSVIVPSLFLTPIDGGMLTLLTLFTGGSEFATDYWIGTVLCIVLYAGLTLVQLRLNQAVAVRQRVLPPKSMPGSSRR